MTDDSTPHTTPFVVLTLDPRPFCPKFTIRTTQSRGTLRNLLYLLISSTHDSLRVHPVLSRLPVRPEDVPRLYVPHLSIRPSIICFHLLQFEPHLSHRRDDYHGSSLVCTEPKRLEQRSRRFVPVDREVATDTCICVSRPFFPCLPTHKGGGAGNLCLRTIGISL